jgi:predicted nuclease of predicted toxin-antitoxin system
MLLFDNNLSPKLVKQLAPLFPSSGHVADFGLEATDDSIIWNFALQNGFALVSKDEDFVHLLHHKGFPPKVIRLNCGNVTTSYIAALFTQEESVIKSFLASSQHGLLVLY